ncbi:MAG: metallophosphoesterase [Opitutales bacterium]|nr:metallophosphoesterase [Opitutales bacterium]
MTPPLQPRIVALAGPSGSGKSLLAGSLRESLGIEVCTVLSIDSYYRDLGHLPPEAREQIDFDHPDALDTDRILTDLADLRTGRPIARPHYDFHTHTRSPISEALAPAPLILVEGIFALALEALQTLFDETWYLHVDADTCLARRLARDVSERGRDPAEVRARFERDVRPSIVRWVSPQRDIANHVFDGREPIGRLLAAARARLPEPLTAPTAENRWRDLPETFLRLGTRVGMEALGTRLERQASHWAGLHHQGEGLLRIERYIPIDQLLGHFLHYSGLGFLGRRNAARLRIERNTLSSPALPTALDGFTLLHLSDLHLDLETGVLPALLSVLPTLHYDLAVITGDFRNSTRGDFSRSLELTHKLIHVLNKPVFGILGNHDFIEMVPGLEATGLRLLLNQGVFIQRGAARLFLAGIDDPHFYRTHDLARAGCLPSAPDTFRILLSHSPETFRAAAPHFDFMLSGHTHGGQVCLPGRIPIIRNGNCPARLLSGAWQEGSLSGYTSRGAGCCGIPARFFCPPEITLHTLRCS